MSEINLKEVSSDALKIELERRGQHVVNRDSMAEELAKLELRLRLRHDDRPGIWARMEDSEDDESPVLLVNDLEEVCSPEARKHLTMLAWYAPTMYRAICKVCETAEGGGRVAGTINALLNIRADIRRGFDAHCDSVRSGDGLLKFRPKN